MIIRRITGEISMLCAELQAEPDRERILHLLSGFLEGLQQDLKNLEHERAKRQTSEMQMELALCYSDDALCITNKEGNIRMVNPALERLLGFSGADLIGTDVSRFWSASPENARTGLQKAHAAKQTWRGELTAATKTGAPLIVELSAAPLISPLGELTHWVYIQRDITQRKALEEKLTAQKTLLEKVLNLSLNATAVITPDGGWELDNLSMKTLLSDMGDRSRQRLPRQLLQTIGNQTMLKAATLDIPLASGAKGHYILDAERIPASYLMPHSTVKHLFLVTLTDVTALLQKNREILARQKALSSSQIEQTLSQEELANGLIHRMRQPLNVGLAIAGRMRELLAKRDMGNMEITAQLMRQQFETMETELSRFREISAPLDLRGKCTASGLLESAAILYAPRCRGKGVDLRILNGAGDTPMDYSEELLLMTLFKLLDNALESIGSRADNRIAISAYPIGDQIALAVEDSGTGIAQEDRYRVFEPLYTTKPGHKGLSLTLVHQVVNRTGGWIDIENSELGGAKFVLRLPLAGGAPCTT